ncbi:MAG: hypothetical protein KGJ60_04435, partial [Verrucomicrobiota bacterium]|nr:hypothetical protein [Verrucomicrobiota bacterium]
MTARHWARAAALAALALAAVSGAAAQTTLVSEGFEGAFPGAWSTGDSNSADGIVTWKDEYTTFGSVPAHTGYWKGYCAGISNGVPVSVAGYANNMQAYMSRTINLSGYTGANLGFWYDIPSIETPYDHFRVYMDATLLFDADAATAGWQFLALPLNAYLGGAHTLRFEFDSDFSVTYEGAYLDDIQVDAANQPFTQSLLSLTNANYSGYVLDSDTFLGRSNIQAQAIFSVENFTGANALYTNILSFRLINASNGVPHPIYDFGNTTTNSGYTYDITNVLLLAAGTNVTVTNVAYLRPAAWMSQFTPFYLECRMLTNGVVAQTLTTAPTNYYHFTNTVSGDAAFNVLLNLTNSAWSRTYAVRTVPGQNTFQVNVGYEVRRWDDFNAAQAATNIPVVFNYTLRDSAGNVVPLASDSQTFYDSVWNYAYVFIFQVPSFQAASHTLDIQPLSQLDSVSQTYYLTVTISHTNDPVTGQVITANTQLTPTNELLHFDGNLIFGGIGTTMSALGAPPPPANPPSGGVIPTTLSGAGGYVTAKTDHTYSGAGPLSVNLETNGDAAVAAGTVLLNAPSPDSDTLAGVRFQRGPVTLSSSGASADVTAILPTGFGYRLGDVSNLVVSAFLPFTGVPLTSLLSPANNLTYLPGTTIYAAEEDKPVWLVSDRIVWLVNSGTFGVPPTGPGATYVRA